ncbi:MAG: hypothetical protein ACO4AI_14125 [Prochlorothrix sp.]
MKVVITPINRPERPGYILSAPGGPKGGNWCDTFEQLVDGLRDRFQERGCLYGPEEPVAAAPGLPNPYTFSVAIQGPDPDSGCAIDAEGGTFPEQ